MKEARKARGAHRMNIDAQERFERANLPGSLALTGRLSFDPAMPVFRKAKLENSLTVAI